MEHNFGELIKAMRKKRGLTQEQLADRLGVTFQSVSKWETNTSLPDITLLPAIANLFNVTTDELLGVDILKAKEREQQYFEQGLALMEQWKLEELVEHYRAALRELPGSQLLRFKFAEVLNQLGKNDEAIKIHEQLMEEAENINNKLAAMSNLSYNHYNSGNIDAALKIAEDLPHIFHTQQYVIGSFGMYKGDRFLVHERYCLWCAYDLMRNVVLKMCEHRDDALPDAQCVEILTQLLQIQQIVFGEDMKDEHFMAEIYNCKIAGSCVKLERYDEALTHLEAAYAHAEAHERYNAGDCYSSVMMEGRASQPQSEWSQSAFKDMLDTISEDKTYDFSPLSEEPRFTALLEKLRERVGTLNVNE